MAEKKKPYLVTAEELLTGIKGMSEAEVLHSAEDFFKDVENNGYVIVPTLSAFADYIEQSRADVHEWVRLHPTASKQIAAMCADTIASGAMLKKYVPNVTNFALKNMCGWEEAPKQSSSKSKETADEKKAKSMLDEYMAQERRKKLYSLG
jgi:hypothetical protein